MIRRWLYYRQRDRWYLKGCSVVKDSLNDNTFLEMGRERGREKRYQMRWQRAMKN